MEQPDHISTYKILSEEMGATINGNFLNFPLALHPFVTTKKALQYYKQLHTVWQRVLLRVAKDHDFLLKLLSPLTQENKILEENLKILQKIEGRQLKAGICVDRIDYYQDISGADGQPKITEYNLICVGHQAPSEIYQAKRRQLENDPSYFDNSTAANCTQAICQLLQLTKKEGIALYVVHEPERLGTKKDMNYLDWLAFTAEFAKHSVKMVPTNMKELAEKLTLRNDGDLYFGEERVAVVYYRTVFKVAHYVFGNEGDFERSFAAKEMICKSNAFSIPPIEFELANMKRVQTELAKPDVLRRYATEQEAEMLSKTRVGEWDFDNISEQDLSALTAKVEANPEGFILKPNMQGGSNNLYGPDVLPVLRGDPQKLRYYILMERINIKSYQNVAIVGQKICEQADKYYQIGLFGTLTWSDNEIISNKADGFHIRAKPASIREGSISKGTTSITTWKLDEN